MIGGGISFTNAYQQTSPSTSFTNTTLSLQIGAFRFSGNRFGYGIDAGIGFGSNSYKYPSPIVDTTYTSLNLSISPSAGLYIPLSSERTYFTLVGAYTFSMGNSDTSPGKSLISFSNSVSFAPGVIYFINENVGFSAQLAFATQSNPMPQLAVKCLLPKRK
jgi:hypothetical protein